MIQSIFIYGFLGLCLWYFGRIASIREYSNLRTGNQTSFWTWEIIFSLFIFAFFSGVRWKVGTDHQSYLSSYLNLVNGLQLRRDNIESGFLVISKVLANLNTHFAIFFGLWAFLQLFFVFYTFKKQRYILPYLGFLIIFGGQYLMWMNGIRQAIAACIFVFSTQFIIQRRFIKYLLVILLATLFHQSAIILILFYFIPNKNYFKNRYLAVIALICSIIIGSNPYWLTATDEMTRILSYIGYEDYSLKLDYIINNLQREMSFGPRRIVNNLICIFLIWIFPSYYRESKNKHVLFMFNLTILGAFHYNLFANTGPLFLRPTYYFTIFTPITTSFILYFLRSKSQKNKFSLKFAILFFISISYLILNILADSGKDDLDFSNYKFFWNY